MPSGGFRPGAGRKKGSVSKMSEEARAIALAGGQSPLDYLLSVMRDINNDLSTRLDAAKAAAPFLHARLSTIALSARRLAQCHQQRADERRGLGAGVCSTHHH